MKLANIIIVCFCFFCSSCSYHWTQDSASCHKPTVQVPFIEGDEDGTFTAELIRTITALGIVKLTNQEPDFTLNVKILDTNINTIGYRWDKQKVSGELTNSIVACEARRSIKAEFYLIESSTMKKLGPFIVEDGSDFDYVDGDCLYDLSFKNSLGERIITLPFSLGQLEPQESAREAAQKPLYRKISQKIADSLFTNF